MTRPAFTPRRLLDELRSPLIDAPEAEVIDPCAGTGHWYLLAGAPLHPRQHNTPQGHRTGARPACETEKDPSSLIPLPDRPGQPVGDTYGGEDLESSDLGRGRWSAGAVFGLCLIGVTICLLFAVAISLILRLP